MKIAVSLLDASRSHVECPHAGKSIDTDTPPEYGGEGRSFSSTDLVAAALGSCVATSVAKILERNDVPLHDVIVEVEKSLLAHPRRIGALAVAIRVSRPIDSRLARKLLRAAQRCPVRQSLHPEIATAIEIVGSEYARPLASG